MIDLNMQVAAPGTEEAMNSAIAKFKKGKVDFVFKGDYIGKDHDDPSVTYDLSKGYIENKNTSYPLFNYMLSEIITVVE